MIGHPDGWCFVENPKAASSSVRVALQGIGGVQLWPKHMPYMHDQKMLPRHNFVFSVVRNPWDRLASGWGYHTQCNEPFDQWLTGKPWYIFSMDFKRTSQFLWVKMCQKVLKFEQLDEDWAKLCQRLDFGNIKLTHNNQSAHPHYRDLYTPKLRDLVADRFYDDIKEWGYEF